MDDHTHRLSTVEHGSLDDRAEFRWEPCVLEREGQVAEDLMTVAHSAIVFGEEGR